MLWWKGKKEIKVTYFYKGSYVMRLWQRPQPRLLDNMMMIPNGRRAIVDIRLVEIDKIEQQILENQPFWKGPEGSLNGENLRNHVE